MTTITGIVRDVDDAPQAGVITRAYRRDTGALLGAGTSGDGSTPLPGDPHYTSVGLLLHFSGANGGTTITDSSPAPLTITPAGSAALSSSAAKWGATSLALPTTASYLRTQVGLGGAGDFTVEAWINVAAIGAYATIVCNSAQFMLIVSPTGGLYFYDGGHDFTAGTGLITPGQWCHVALTRASGVYRMFIDGAAAGTNTFSATYATPADTWISHGWGGFSNGIVGYIDDVRITVGVARYTAPFTAPAYAFPDAETYPALDLGQYQIETTYAGEVQLIHCAPDGETLLPDLISRVIVP